MERKFFVLFEPHFDMYIQLKMKGFLRMRDWETRDSAIIVNYRSNFISNFGDGGFGKCVARINSYCILYIVQREYERPQMQPV